ncbi:MAG TPA: hypothetical protein VJ697_14865 [Nitrososphaeraceae archaeon]|nr:hypothetical protein [Nitrososphaeraceae archaeon]
MISSLYFKNRDKSLLGYLFHIHGYNRIETDKADIIIGIENGNTVWRLLKNQPDAINRLIDMLEKTIVYFVQQFLRSIPDLEGYIINHYINKKWRNASNAI